MRIVAVGEILWDVFEDSERLGGAPFNFSAHAARLGHAVDFVSAVGDDPRGRRAYDEAARLGVGVDFLATAPGRATGHVTVELTGGEPEYTIHRPAAYDAVRLSDDDLAALAGRQPDCVYFGTLFAHDPDARRALSGLLAALPGVRRFYDVNLRRDSWSADDVDALLDEADVVKLNEDEAERLAAMFGWPASRLEDLAAAICRTRRASTVCVTRGANGCGVLIDGRWIEAPGTPVQVADAVGAGDAFSAAFLHGLASGWPPERIGEFANRVGALVASRRGGVPEWTEQEAWALRPAV